jgi:uncharacterized protein YcfL
MRPLQSMSAIGILTTGLLAGCGSSNVYETSNARPNAVEFESKISNPELKGKVDVQSAFVGNTPDGLLRVQWNIANRSVGNAFYMYRVTWFDSAGLKIGNNHDFWTRREMNGGAVDEISGLAPNLSAVDWRLEIRKWDR